MLILDITCYILEEVHGILISRKTNAFKLRISEDFVTHKGFYGGGVSPEVKATRK